MKKLKNEVGGVTMFGKFRNKFVYGDFTIIDYVIISIILIFCFFSFQQGDILHTAGSSFAILNGHLLDFYDYNAAGGMPDAYMISTYLLFAVWNIPLRLMGLGETPTMAFPTYALMWFKLLPVLFYVACGYLVYLIALEIGFNKNVSKAVMITFYTTPIAVFSQFIFGQYDSITLFFMLLGIYHYFKDNNKGFVLSFAIALTFKYFALLVFLPLLMLKIKDIWKIIFNCVGVVSFYLIETLIYVGSDSYGSVTEFGAVDYVFKTTIYTGFYNVSLVVIVVGVVSAFAYFKQISSKKELVEWAFYLSNLIMFAFFGLCPWHPQWLLLMVPFLVIGAFINRETKIYLILDIALFLLEMMYVANYWTDHVDQALLRLGVWGKYIGGTIGTGLMMKDIYIIHDLDLIGSLFVGILLIMALFKHPRYNKEEFSDDINETAGWIRTRFLCGMALFLLPVAACVISVI